jgi:hypothetical protein
MQFPDTAQLHSRHNGRNAHFSVNGVGGENETFAIFY